MAATLTAPTALAALLLAASAAAIPAPRAASAVDDALPLPPPPQPLSPPDADGDLVGRGVEVAVECVPSSEDADAVLCRPATTPRGPRGPRRLLGRIGFLAGLHLGGAISSSGSLSASHSLNVFGKVMNTALSVSYGPNGYYQGPGGPGGHPPLVPIGPGFGGGLADAPNAPSSPASASAPLPDRGGEASAVLAGSISRDAVRPGPTAARLDDVEGAGATPQNRLPVAEDIVGDVDLAAAPARVKVVVEAPAGPGSTVSVSAPQGLQDAVVDKRRRADVEPAPIHEHVDEDVVGEEPLPDAEALAAQQAPLQLASERRAQLEAVARIRTPSADEQRKLFLQHHNKHVTAFNRHFAKYNGDVSRVAVFSRT